MAGKKLISRKKINSNSNIFFRHAFKEWVVTSNENLFEPDVNAAGAAAIPQVNEVANSLNSFVNDYDVPLQQVKLLKFPTYFFLKKIN